jgi:EmrB/QacA subfamily drug resistance transporter
MNSMVPFMNSSAPQGRTYSERAVLLVAGTAVFAVFLDTTILFVAFSSIGASFPDASTSDLSWVLNAYTIVFAACLVPAGVLADRIGRRRVFLASIAAFTVASALAGLAPSVEALIAARAVQAIGAAAMIPASLSLVLQSTARERVPAAVAVWGSMGAVAGALGPAVGALVIDAASWRAAFLINVPVGIASIIAVRRIVPDHAPLRAGRLPDALGTPLVIAGTGLITLALVQGESWGWTSARTLLAAAAGAVALGVLAYRSFHHPSPLIEARTLRSRSIGAANAATLVFGAGFTAMFLDNVLFLQGAWEFSTLETGIALTPGPLLVAALAPRFGRLAVRTGQRPLLIAGGLVFATAAAITATMPADPVYATRWLPNYLLMGLGVALTLPQLSSASVQGLTPSRFAAGVGTNQAIRNVGATLGVAGLVVILTSAAPADRLAAFHDAGLACATAGLLVAAIATTMPRRRATAEALVVAEPALAEAEAA